MRDASADVDQRIGRRFADASDPLLSVRTGARFSIPGMMGAVLDRRGVSQSIEMATQRCRCAEPKPSVSICGERGGERSSIAFCSGAGLDDASDSRFRLPIARPATAHAALGEASRDV